MRSFVVPALLLLLAVPPARGQNEDPPAPEALPTLEDVVFIESGVDRNDVFLGETVTLTLIYGELTFRGIRVEDHYKTRQTALPESEGFVAGAVREEVREVTRDGFPYALTTYRVPLYPTRAGELSIGAWRWQGTARGYTASGARSRTMDLRTEPISISVRPLPPSPPTFGGAVGDFTLSAALESTELTQGIPVSLHIDISGVGNLQALRAPAMPRALWYRLGDPVAAEATAVAGRDDTESKRFTYSLLPLRDGTYSLGPIAWTWFSPASEAYVEASVPAMEVRVQPSGIDERLVVSGGVGHEASGGLLVTEDGRLPLVAESGPLAPRRSWPKLSGTLGALPVVLFLLVFIARRASWPTRGRKGQGSATRHLQDALGAGQPASALRFAILQELEGLTGWSGAGMAAREVEGTLAERGWGEMGSAIGEALRRCEAVRYGAVMPQPEELSQIAARAGAALDDARARRAGG